MAEPKRTRPAAIWTGAGALLTGAVWAATQIAGGGTAQAHAVTIDHGEVAELRSEMRELTKKLDDFNTRLAHLEGRADPLPLVVPAPVRSSGIGR